MTGGAIDQARDITDGPSAPVRKHETFRATERVFSSTLNASFIGHDDAGISVWIHRFAAVSPTTLIALAQRVAAFRRASIPHAASLRFADTQASGVVVTGRFANQLTQVLTAAPLPADAVTRLAQELAACLCAAHRAGIVHGALCPRVVGIDEAGGAYVDLFASGSLAGDAIGEHCRAPELVTTVTPTAAADVYALGAVLDLAARGAAALTSRQDAVVDAQPSALERLRREMCDAEPAWRPTMREIVARLSTLASSPIEGSGDGHSDAETAPTRIGRFELGAVLGEGSMGRVYVATDMLSGDTVALKIIARDGIPTARALRRFKKEARILGELSHPTIARLIASGEDAGRLYMAVELVAGKTLTAELKEHGPMAELDALRIAIELARALVTVHAAGIIHRDIKPDNVVVVRGPQTSTVKLIDFGIARHVDERESLAMTRQGAVLGTPLYMAPEQARGDVVDARTDLYALGTLLFELLCGRAPFAGHGATQVLAMQIEARPPGLAELRGDVTDETARLVSWCLEKDPAARVQTAQQLLDALHRITERDAVTLPIHPLSPQHVDRAGSVLHYQYQWQLKATPAALWPHVSNTDSLNRAVGLGAVEESFAEIDGELRRFGATRQSGFDLRWHEHPFEWVFEQRLGVLREYTSGPLRWLKSTVELHENAGGTRLVHTVDLEPRGLLGRAAAGIEVGLRSKRALQRTYQRIDDLVGLAARTPHNAIADSFGERVSVSGKQLDRLLHLERDVVAAGADAAAVLHLGEFLRTAPAMAVARIRPLTFARRANIDDDAMVRACLLAARAGMLVCLWDLLCPSCRAPSDMEMTLRALKEHGRCDVCNIAYELDLSTSIELVFRAHPSVRTCDPQTYCLSSPVKTPHVVAQVRLAPMERFVLQFNLQDGLYQVLARREGWLRSFRVEESASTTSWHVELGAGLTVESVPVLSRRHEIVVVNATSREQLVRVERTAPRDDVLSAARASAHPLFRQLFPYETFKPGALLRVAQLTFLVVEVRSAILARASEGNVDAYATLYGAFKAVEEHVLSHGGAAVKVVSDGVVAVFDDSTLAINAALTVRAALAKVAAPCELAAGVHRGAAAAVTLNDRLDYFGRAPERASAMCHLAADGELCVSGGVIDDPSSPLLFDLITGTPGLRFLPDEDAIAVRLA